MRTNIISIGNSKGLILSKTILEKYQIKNEVNIRFQDEYLIIEPVNNPRLGWADQFSKAKSTKENEQLIPDVFEDEELLPWE
jgi:antitoxin MazE